ncbi:lysophospholipid acyltransferase family protein [Candidatus Peregrinibacteria bacterium]|nr:lysophospholipid acyltransferase family protein [Candidatus Peregrinibacteria bacterium]
MKIRNFSNYLVDLLILAIIPKSAVPSLLKNGICPHFPKGAIITSAHLGNWELVAILARPITVLAKDTKLKYLTGVERVRKRFGVNVLYIDKTSTRVMLTTLLAALQHGEFVGIMSDRNYSDKTRLPKGAARLSYITGAPIVPVFAIFKDGLYDIEIDAPIYAHRNGVPKNVHIEEITRRIADSFSVKINSYPDQWFNFDN